MHIATGEAVGHREVDNGIPLSSASIGARILARIGPLEVRLAQSDDEIVAAQEIRYRVFFEEQGAASTKLQSLDRRDADRFDAVCDHVLVLDQSLPGPERQRVVGTYRLLRAEGAALAGGYYSDDEFEIDGLVRREGNGFLELGRSCVLPAYRSKRTIEALWQGIWAYVQRHHITLMGGCASFRGVVPAAHAEALSFLAHNCQPDPDHGVRARPDRHVSMDLMPAEGIEARAALQKMPALVKGYLRLGAGFGDGCVVDHDFGTVDVFVILPVKAIRQRYIAYYS